MRSAAFVAVLSVLVIDDSRAADDVCKVLTAADIKAVTGESVQPVPKGAFPGAGGCVNFKDAAGEAYLGIDRHRGTGAYKTAVGSVPQDVYPNRTPVPGLGDEAVLMKDETQRMRYLVARKGETTIVLFPLTYDKSAGGKMQYRISDGQLRQLAERALAAK